MSKSSTESYHDKIFKKALSNLISIKEYHAYPPLKRHEMLMKEFEKLYWEEKEND